MGLFDDYKEASASAFTPPTIPDEVMDRRDSRECDKCESAGETA